MLPLALSYAYTHIKASKICRCIVYEYRYSPNAPLPSLISPIPARMMAPQPPPPRPRAPPAMKLPAADYERLLQAFDALHRAKARRAEVARRYFENHREECYARQKRWRESVKPRINARRRAAYRQRKEQQAQQQQQ